MRDIRRTRMIMIKQVVGGLALNIFSAYAPQVGSEKEVKTHFWEDLDEVVRGISCTKNIVSVWRLWFWGY